MIKELTAAQRRALRAQAHSLHPVVLIGDNGLTDAVLHEIEVGLRSHELIKVRAQAARDEREAWLRQICERLFAQPVQHIGKTLVLYRERPADAESQSRPRSARAAVKPPRPRTQSKRAADRARARINAGRAPAAAPGPRRARTR